MNHLSFLATCSFEALARLCYKCTPSHLYLSPCTFLRSCDALLADCPMRDKYIELLLRHHRGTVCFLVPKAYGR